MLENKFGDMDYLKPIFLFSFQASADLGPWCSDEIWKNALSEKLLPKFQGKITKSSKLLSVTAAASKVESDTSRLKEAAEIIAGYEMASGSDIIEQLSDKVRVLYRNLLKTFQNAPDTKCIVFTKQRNTAYLLDSVFQQLCVPNLRPGVLVGVRTSDVSGMNTTYHRQLRTTIDFRKGSLNCLVRQETLLPCLSKGSVSC